MDISTIDVDHVPTLSVFFWALAAIAFISIFLIRFLIRITNLKSPHAPGALLIASVSVMVIGFTAGASAAFINTVQIQNNFFQEKLESDYGLRTSADFYAVKKAALDRYTVEMSDENGTFDVRPYLDGEKLTFFKLAKGEPINPRT